MRIAALANELKSATVVMQAAARRAGSTSRRSATARFRERYDSEQDARDAILTRLNNVDGIFSSQLSIEIQRRHAVGARCRRRSAVRSHFAEHACCASSPTLRKRSPELNSQGLTHLFTDRNLDGTHDRHRVSRLAVRCQNGVGLTESRNVVAGLAGRRARDRPQLRRGPRRRFAGQLPEHAVLRLPHGAGRERHRRFLAVQPDAHARAHAAGELHHQPAAGERAHSRRPRHCAPAARPLVRLAAADRERRRPELTQRARRADAAGHAHRSSMRASSAASCTSGGGAIECQLGDIAGRQPAHDRAGAEQRCRRLARNRRARHRGQRHAIARTTTARARSSSNRRRTYRCTLRGPATAMANERFTVGFDVANIATDNAGTVTVKIDIPAGTTVRSASLSERHLHERRCQHRVHAGAAQRLARPRAARCRSRRQPRAARPCTPRLRRLLRHEQCQRHGRPGRRRQRRSRRSRVSRPQRPAAAAVGWRLDRPAAAPGIGSSASRPPPARLKAHSTVAM